MTQSGEKDEKEEKEEKENSREIAFQVFQEAKIVFFQNPMKQLLDKREDHPEPSQDSPAQDSPNSLWRP